MSFFEYSSGSVAHVVLSAATDLLFRAGKQVLRWRSGGRTAILLLAIAHSLAEAQSDASAPIVLQIPASAYAQGMGDAYLTSHEHDVLFYNPAQLAIARGMGLNAGRYGSAATAGSLSSATALGGAGGVAIGVQLVSYRGGVTRFPEAVRYLGAAGSTAATSAAVTIGGATVVHDTRFGAAVKYVGDERGGARGGTAAADLAVARDVGARREITVTFVAQNLGRDLTVVDVHTPLPRRLSLGAGTARLLPVGPFDVGLEGDVSLLRDGSVAPAAGGEASYEWLDGYVLAARAGVRRADVVQGEVGHATGTVGGSVTADRVSLDYGFAREAGVGVHRFGIRLR